MKTRREKIAAYQREGSEALAKSDVERALKAFQSAQGLDLSNMKTFSLIEQAHKQKADQEAHSRLKAYQGRASGKVGALPVQPSPAVSVKPASEPAAASSEQEYTVQSEDVLQITVYEEPDLTTKARVSRNGEITMPLLGQVAVAGLTVPAVQEKLAHLLEKDFLVHPQVQVFVDKPRNVFVTGQVHRPGSYPVSVERPTTVIEAITLAGGFTQDADLNGTRIIRRVNGEKRTIRIRVTDIIRQGDKSKDETVRAEDIIFVPESFF